MILKSVRLQNFRCVKDSENFKVDESVTCLVGKNESGKTALLQALNKLNPVIEEDEDFQDLDYPAMEWTEYKARKESDPAPALTTIWKLEPDDVNVLQLTFGPSIDYTAEVEVSKGYSNVLTWSVRVDEARLVEFLIAQHGLLEDERASLKSLPKLAEITKRLSELEDPTNHQKELLGNIQTEFGAEGADAKAYKVLAARLPRFVYFAEYLRLPGRVSINDLKARQAKSDPNKLLRGSDRAFLAYLSLISATTADLEKTMEFERLTRELEGASNYLTTR